ncbi:NEM-activable K(+)/H(+) antiporter [Chryseobacterium gleum]|uniref:NEM-activable K(+)/H(+) antiporter n=2 Tax=Chryseobacterium gleum TaxID=250 RepID=A0A3S5E2S8_CHRGE|nr:cation:proton antiporter [Chryseobacterium gleum]MCD9616917.1 cation:proton antiporter [Chryseobacterium gleum]QBJ86052.1 cation:proton antiporter [Chryseobacterium gleum]QQY34325.1 cation:proton antiporter [Chryseobacterium gleum]VEE06827.1 NEM-activable K(+)/H(+) antiporter [Chryseobacterium gleum]
MLWTVCVLCMTILGLMFLLKRLHQPYLIAYIIAGILLGPYGVKLFDQPEEIEAVGEAGILLLMFFIGMEINVPNKKSLIIKPVLAQGIKILLSFMFAFLLGWILTLDFKSILLIAILFTFNSTAVVVEFLKKHGTLHTAFGIVILNILLLQDLLLAPVLTLLKFWNGEKFNMLNFVIPLAICIGIFLIFRKIRHLREIRFSSTFLENDHDLQVFSGLFICLGFGLVAEVVGLSAALGSFIAGVVVGKIRAFHWLEHSLLPFKVFFVALFFVSIGLRLDLNYLFSNYVLITIGTLVVLISNSVMSSIFFRILNFRWKDSFYGGALLSQTGEFGILALSIAYKTGMVGYDLYKAGLGITCLSLLLSTIWISCSVNFRRNKAV